MTVNPRGLYTLIIAAALLLIFVIAGFAQDFAVEPTAIRARPQALWVTDYLFVTAYQGAKLKHSGTPIPDFGFKRNSIYDGPLGAAFDNSNNLWVIYFGSDQVLELTRPQLSAIAAGGRVKPKVVLTPANGPTGLPTALAFDSSGDLWVGNLISGQISEFTPDQLKKSGTLVPATSITLDLPSTLSRLRFDKAGNLWIVGSVVISKLTPDQLATGGLLTPALTLEIVRNWTATDLAFDSAGNMWTAVEYIFGKRGVLDMVNAADLDATGDTTLAPSITISPAPNGSGDSSNWCPSGLAFDHQGDLWFSNQCASHHGSIVELSPAALAASGSPVPKVVLGSNKRGTSLDDPSSILFGPLAP
jgi:hypothetical protein